MLRRREEETFTVANRGGWLEVSAYGQAESIVRVPCPKDHNILRIKDINNEKLNIEFVGKHVCMLI